MAKYVKSVTFSHESKDVFHFKCPLCHCATCIKLVPLLYVGESTLQTCQTSQLTTQQETDQKPRLNTCDDHAHKHKTQPDLGGQNHVTKIVDKENTEIGVEHIDHNFYTHFGSCFLRGIVGLDQHYGIVRQT